MIETIVSSTPPSHPGHPLVGNALQFTSDPFAFLESLSATDEDVVRVNVGQPAYVACSPEAVRTILVDRHDAFERSSFFVEDLEPLIGTGLLTAQDEQWHRQRSVVGPAFFGDRIRAYGEVVSEVAREQFSGEGTRGTSWVAGDLLDLTREMREIGVEVIARSLLGVSLRDRLESIHEISQATIDYYEVRAHSEIVPDWIPTPTSRRFEAAMGDLEVIVDDVLAVHHDDSFLDDLVTMTVEGASDGTVDDSEVRDLVRVFLLAGADTTALAMGNGLTLLAQHPEALAALRTELDEELGDADPTAEDLPRLPTLEAVLNETLRLYPSAFAVYRQPRWDVEVAGYTLEEDRLVIVPQWAIHRDERFFEEPLAFRPERWADPDHPDYAFFPFGAGPFTCIGNRLAMLEARLVVAMAVRRFDVEHVDGDITDRRAAITTQPNEHLLIDVSPRGSS